MRPREDGRFGEEQVGVELEHAGDPSDGVLVEQAVQALNDLIEGIEDVVEEIDSEAGIGRCQQAEFRAAPDGRDARRERHGVG
jgi:hypothetical protein